MMTHNVDKASDNLDIKIYISPPWCENPLLRPLVVIMAIEAMANDSEETALRGVTLEDKPGAYKQNGHWVGIAHDVLELLQRVRFLSIHSF